MALSALYDSIQGGGNHEVAGCDCTLRYDALYHSLDHCGPMMKDAYDVLAETGKKLIECGDHRASLRSALTTIANWATMVPDDKLRERMDLIKQWAEESANIGLPMDKK
jgi:hypothetical protein